jgi:putative ABC transport system permease protein
MVLLIGVDPEDEAHIRTYELADGTFLDPADPTGVLVNAGWARDNDVVIGDQLLLNGRREAVPANHVVGLLEDSGFGALGSGRVVVLDRRFLADAFIDPVAVRYVDLQLGDPAHTAEVQAALDEEMTEPFVVETLADSERQLARAQAGFAGLAFLFGLVALAVGAFLVANTLAMTVAERTREIGLLRAAGTTSRQVLGLFLRQGLALAVIGGAAGALLGVAVAALMITFLQSTRALLITGLPFDPLALMLAFALGAAVTLAASLVPALAAARVSPLDALRPSRQPGRTLGGRLPWLAGLVIAAVAIEVVAYPLQRGQSSLTGSLLAVGILLGGALLVAVLLQPVAAVVGRPFATFFGAQGFLGRANLRRDPVRTGLTVGALAIGLSSVVALGVVSSSARATAEKWVDSILPWGHAVRLSVPDEIETLRPSFEGIFGVRNASPIAEFPAVELTGAAQREVGIAAIDPQTFNDSGSLIFVEGRRGSAYEALGNGGAILVPEALAVRDGLSMGEVVDLGLPGSEGQPFKVAGIVLYSLPTRTAEGAVLMSLSDARERFGVTQAGIWVLEPDPDVPEDAFNEAVSTKAAELFAEVLTSADLASELGRSLDRVIGLFDVLALLAVLIGGLGIVNTMAVGIVERGREIAILRSHGMTAGQVQAMVLAEASIIGTVGGLAAVGIGILVAWVTVSVAAPSDFSGGLALPWGLLLAVVLLGIGVASAAGILPARAAAATPITDQLRHFE